MRYQLDLTEQSIDNLIKYLNHHLDFSNKVDEFCARLAEIAVDTATTIVPVATGNLKSGIRFEKRGEGEVAIISDGEYAAFVEFGTGVVGEGTYEGQLPSGWTYDTRATPWAHDSLDPTFWAYRNDFGGITWTQGESAANYMFRSSQELRAAVKLIAKEVFSFV